MTFQPDVILSDVQMPGMNGLMLLDALRQTDAPPLVLMTAHGHVSMAVDAIQRGAFSFVEKPFDSVQLLSLLDQAATRHVLVKSAQRMRERLATLSGLDRIYIGISEQAVSLRHQVLDLADIDAPVLLCGETGTGKELIARALHDLGPRAGLPFVALSCATIPAPDFWATMFGVPGQSPGMLAAAGAGTLFLDEVGACPLEVQAQLLRVLETRTFTPAGDTHDRPLRARIVSATNADLEDGVATGRFRRDLLYRLNPLTLRLPALRGRPADMPLLLTHFTAQFARIYACPCPDLTEPDLAALLVHDWPGNIRELRNVAERWVLSCRRGVVPLAQAIQQVTIGLAVPATLREAVAVFERELLARALIEHDGRMDDVATALGIGRRTLNEKIVKLGLDKAAVLARAPN